MRLMIVMVLMPLCVYGMEIEKVSLCKPSHLAALKLYREQNGFEVEYNNERKVIPSYNVDPVMREMDLPTLTAFLKNGYIKIHELEGPDYKLAAHSRLCGGGPMAGMVGYWGTKAVAGSIVATTISFVINKITGRHTGTCKFCGRVLNRGMKMYVRLNVPQGIMQDAFEGYGYEEKAAEGTAAFIVSAGGGVGTIAAVESAAIWVGGILTAVPWLP